MVANNIPHVRSPPSRLFGGPPVGKQLVPPVLIMHPQRHTTIRNPRRFFQALQEHISRGQGRDRTTQPPRSNTLKRGESTQWMWGFLCWSAMGYERLLYCYMPIFSKGPGWSYYLDTWLRWYLWLGNGFAIWLWRLAEHRCLPLV